MVNALELHSHGPRDGGLKVDEHRKRLMEPAKRAVNQPPPEELTRGSNEKLL